jgi:hypothetical protein
MGVWNRLNNSTFFSSKIGKAWCTSYQFVQQLNQKDLWRSSGYLYSRLKSKPDMIGSNFSLEIFPIPHIIPEINLHIHRHRLEYASLVSNFEDMSKKKANVWYSVVFVFYFQFIGIRVCPTLISLITVLSVNLSWNRHLNGVDCWW